MSYNLEAPGWVLVADEWRWTGAGDPPELPARKPEDTFGVGLGWST